MPLISKSNIIKQSTLIIILIIAYCKSYQVLASFIFQNRKAISSHPMAQQSADILRMSGASSNGEEMVQNELSSSGSRPIVHFCFLIHGWLGNSKELGNVETAVKQKFNEEIASNRNTSEGAADSILVAHVVSCNDGATSDGVELGGKRVEEEIKSVLCRFCTDAHKKGSPPDFITISFIGNSLGGLYARYALVNLAHFVDKGFSDNDKMKLPKIYFNVFCTTATPHLGVSRNTYFPIPRVAEQLIGNIMRSTGRDLFRSNSLLSDMALNSKYISPLTLFRKRIAYANSFGTDFQVPTSTAAFLCKQSNYPHTLKEENYDDNGVFFATFCTKANSDYVQVGEHDELCQMSKSLDNLGWTKVFVDTRDILPFGSFRFPFGSDGRASFCNYASSVSGGNRSESSTKIESKKLLSIFSSMNKVHFPLGHTVLVANSKSKFFSYLNRNGRFVVNALAESVVKDILNFKIIQ